MTKKNRDGVFLQGLMAESQYGWIKDTGRDNYNK